MTATAKGLLVVGVQLALVLSLGAKLLYDRHTRPRVWLLGNVYDPELPIRGRYIAEQLHFATNGFTYNAPAKEARYYGGNRYWAYLNLHGNQLVAEPEGSGAGEWVYLEDHGGTITAVSAEPALFFVSDGAKIPAQPHQELWVEVTIPAKGSPRPIQLGIKENDVLTPLHVD